MTPLLLRALDGDWRTVKRLLLAGADATIADDQGFTALHLSSYFGDLDVTRILIANGPVGLVQQTTPDGVSCLHLASQNGHHEVVRVLYQACCEMIFHVGATGGGSCGAVWGIPRRPCAEFPADSAIKCKRIDSRRKLACPPHGPSSNGTVARGYLDRPARGAFALLAALVGLLRRGSPWSQAGRSVSGRPACKL